MFDHEGYEVTAEDILGDDREELATYRRIHPRPVVHQLRFFPDPSNACDECGCVLQPDDGALCIYCAERYEADAQEEWYS